jgi:hypothetical protein
MLLGLSHRAAERGVKQDGRPNTGPSSTPTVVLPRGDVSAPALDRDVGQVRGVGRGGQTRLGAPMASVAAPPRPSPWATAGECLAIGLRSGHPRHA